MLSNHYRYESDSLRDRYLDSDISRDQHTSGLESLKLNEHAHQPNVSNRVIDEEIYEYEIQQRKKIQEALNIRKPEEKLYRERETHCKFEIPLIISGYKDESRRYRNFHNILQWCIIIGSAVVTFSTSATVFANIGAVSYLIKAVSVICSLAVTIAASSMGQFKFRERSNNLQKAVDDIENEYEAVKLGTGLYLDQSREEALGNFVDNILKRIKVQRGEQQILEQPPDVKQASAS